jgi:hypothetical protein
MVKSGGDSNETIPGLVQFRENLGSAWFWRQRAEFPTMQGELSHDAVGLVPIDA